MLEYRTHLNALPPLTLEEEQKAVLICKKIAVTPTKRGKIIRDIHDTFNHIIINFV